jgi:hypothetical protein
MTAATWVARLILAGTFLFVGRVLIGPWLFNRRKTVPFVVAPWNHNATTCLLCVSKEIAAMESQFRVTR